MRIGSRSLLVPVGLALFLGLAAVADAAQETAVGQISSPGTFCTTARQVNSSYSSYGAADQVANKWTIWYGASFPPSQKIYSATSVSFFTQQTFSTSGFYQTCVNNDSSGVFANISITENWQ